MDRIPLITIADGLNDDARSAYDRIVESRGELTRPFQVLLHSPTIAAQVSELGHVIRFGSHLSDADRELVTLATGRSIGCAFVWESHLAAAISAGVRQEAIAALEGGPRRLGQREEILVAFVDELCSTNAVSDATFAAALDLLGVRGTVDLVSTVGYYTMLGRIMGACGTC
jgi:4-carboxymuconolactone decarboxylase